MIISLQICKLIKHYNKNLLDILIMWRGYSLIGKTSILHIDILGSSPDISRLLFRCKSYKHVYVNNYNTNIKITKNIIEYLCLNQKYFTFCIFFIRKARLAQFGRAELWRCLGYKFESYIGQDIFIRIYVRLNLRYK